ncbi:MAG: hypothetical protein E4H20_12015 [Spirochaetales bacterium]|nr:MAG: hypothetical protein E4H20_12015 [Spirochaetales bacterium]
MTRDAILAFFATIWALTRMVFAVTIVATAILAAFKAGLKPKSVRNASHIAVPSAQGAGRLTRIISSAATRGYYRNLLAERLRSLVRDQIALEEGIPDDEAYRRLRDGSAPLDDDEWDLLLSDHLLARPRTRRARAEPLFEPDFIARIERLVDGIDRHIHERPGEPPP